MMCFLRRKSDGKFYRGARFWKWTRSWRHAAVLDKSFWNAIVLPKLTYDNPSEMYELWTFDTKGIAVEGGRGSD